MTRQLACGLALASLLVIGWPAQAEDAKKADPTGTWKWKTNVMGMEVESVLKLKRDRDKLSGLIVGDDKEVKITDGKFKDGEVTFKAVRVRGGQEVLVSYKGKLSGDTIKGTIAVDFGGQEFNLAWEAKRAKDEKKKDQ
jgi:hypothetical protein